MEMYSGKLIDGLVKATDAVMHRVPTCPEEFHEGQRGYTCAKIADLTCSVCQEPFCSEHVDECQKCGKFVCGCCIHKCSA